MPVQHHLLRTDDKTLLGLGLPRDARLRNRSVGALVIVKAHDHDLWPTALTRLNRAGADASIRVGCDYSVTWFWVIPACVRGGHAGIVIRGPAVRQTGVRAVLITGDRVRLTDGLAHQRTAARVLNRRARSVGTPVSPYAGRLSDGSAS